jgi:hypothetical protein
MKWNAVDGNVNRKSSLDYPYEVIDNMPRYTLCQTNGAHPNCTNIVMSLLPLALPPVETLLVVLAYVVEASWASLGPTTPPIPLSLGMVFLSGSLSILC